MGGLASGGGESPNVIGRWAVIRLRYLERVPGSRIGSTLCTLGPMLTAATRVDSARGLDVTREGLVGLRVKGSVLAASLS